MSSITPSASIGRSQPMTKLIWATAAALVLGATCAAADYDYVDDKGYRHWDHTGTDATEKPATPKVSKRRPTVHKTASKPLARPRTLPKSASKPPTARTLTKTAIKPLVKHGTLPVGHAKSGDERPKAKADRDALFHEFQDFLFATKPATVEPPKSEPTPEPQPAGNASGQLIEPG